MLPATTSFNPDDPLSPRRNQAGLTLIELMVAMVISIIVGVAIFEVFIQNEYSYLRNRSTGDIVNSDRHALHVLSNYLSNAGYGLSLPGCQQTYAYLNGAATPYAGITVSPAGTPTSITPAPVTLTINLSASQFAGVPIGQMVQSPQPNASNFQLNSAPGSTTCQTPVQSGDKLIAAFNGGVCGLVIATKTPGSNAGACVVTFDHGQSQPNNPPGGFSTLIPNLTVGEMDAAQVYDLGNGNIDTIQFSVIAGTASTPGSLQMAMGGSTPALFAAGIDDLQVLFGYNTGGGQSVTSYGYYDPTYATDIRTVTISMVAQSKIKTPGTVTPTKILVIPAVPTSQSLTGTALPAIYYQPPTGVTNEEFNLMTTTVPVMNLIWH